MAHRDPLDAAQARIAALERELADARAASEAERSTAPRRKPKRARRPGVGVKAGLLALGAFLLIAAVIAALGALAVPRRELVVYVVLHAIGALLSAHPIYLAVSRWVDPSLETTFQTYTQGTASIRGQRTAVSIATGAKTVRLERRVSLAIGIFGLVPWIFMAGLTFAFIYQRQHDADRTAAPASIERDSR